MLCLLILVIYMQKLIVKYQLMSEFSNKIEIEVCRLQSKLMGQDQPILKTKLQFDQ